MYCDKRLSSLFFSLFLSRERISLFFFHSFVSVISKNLCLVLSLKSSTTARFDENFFVFFKKHKKGAKEEEKDTNARSHSHHHHHSSSHFFISSRVVTPPTPTKTHRTTITLPLLLRDFLRFHTGRERVCVCERERKREEKFE